MLVSFAHHMSTVVATGPVTGIKTGITVLAIMTFNTRMKGGNRGETSSCRFFYINSRAAHADKQQISKMRGNPNYISSEIACN